MLDELEELDELDELEEEEVVEPPPLDSDVAEDEEEGPGTSDELPDPAGEEVLEVPVGPQAARPRTTARSTGRTVFFIA